MPYNTFMMKTTTTMTEKVIDRIEEFCRVLRTNYQESAIARHRDYVNREENVDWHIEQINQLAMGEGVDEFTYTKGRKYAKIIHINCGGQKSVHAFVDMNDGNVYKPKDWRSPSLNGVRYNLLDDKCREQMYRRADYAGGYLYK